MYGRDDHDGRLALGIRMPALAGSRPACWFSKEAWVPQSCISYQTN